MIASKWIGIALISFLTILVLNLTHFCYYRGYVSQQELFENAILSQADNMGDLAPGESARGYLLKHPDCCSMCEDVPPGQSFLDTVLGSRLRYVRVVYPLKQSELDRYPKGGDFYESWVEVTPCGGTRHRIGMRVEERAGRC